jgi:hypothetical protein
LRIVRGCVPPCSETDYEEDELSEEENRRRAHEIYRTMPEDMRDLLMEAAWKATEKYCEETGEEFTLELVGKVAADALWRITGDAHAGMREVTDEEYQRIIDEERERLRTDQGVDEEALVEAVKERVEREYGHVLKPGRPEPD